MITRYLACPWHDFLYNLQLEDIPGADFEISLYAFGQSEKPIVSSMYNNTTNHATTYTNLMISVAQDIYSVKREKTFLSVTWSITKIDAR